MKDSRRCAFDLGHLPLVVVTAPASIDEDGIRDLFARFDALYRARSRLAVLIDTRPTREIPDARLRKVLADLSQASAAEAKRWSIGTAMVVDSALVRGLLTAVAWIVPSATPTVHVTTMKEGADWCLAKLHEVGVELPPELRRYQEELR